MRMLKEAIFSDCGKYRYVLTRCWDKWKPMALCIGLNPSTANAQDDDNTITVLRIMLSHLGFGGFYMCNLFSLISRKPDDLRSCPNPVMDNDKYLQQYAGLAQEIIFCWGTFPMAWYRAKKIAPMFPNAKCFGKNADGTPMHPRAMNYAGLLHKPELINFNPNRLMNSFQKLTKLQLAVGYKEGEINPIALLGLFGEAGEVLNETTLICNNPAIEREKVSAITTARGIDGLKKIIRDTKIIADPVKVFIDEAHQQKFDIELADTLYYLNAIAIGRGKTLADYAEMSYEKVSAKTQIKVD